MPQTDPEHAPLSDERLRKYTDPRRYGPELVSICTELIAARYVLKRLGYSDDPDAFEEWECCHGETLNKPCPECDGEPDLADTEGA